MVIFTGDSPNHNIPFQTPSKNLEACKLVNASMKKHFKNIPIQNAVGNHDTFPVDNFSDIFILDYFTNEFQKSFYDEWKDWLGKDDIEVEHSILKGG